VEWAKLMVAKADVARWWPFHLAAAVADEGPPRTGTPGRPSSIPIIEARLLERYDRGEANRRLSIEAEQLREWFREAYRGWPVPPLKTITNRLRERHPGKFDLTRK
jgi:hypothetical protein